MKILVINCGSSSLKYQLFDMENESVLAKGLCERIGIDGKLTHKPAGKDEFVCEDAMPDHKVAVQMVLEYAEKYNLKRDCLWLVKTIGLSDAVQRAVEAAAIECGFEKVLWIPANGVITTHGGPEAFGLAGFAEE